MKKRMEILKKEIEKKTKNIAELKDSIMNLYIENDMKKSELGWVRKQPINQINKGMNDRVDKVYQSLMQREGLTVGSEVDLSSFEKMEKVMVIFERKKKQEQRGQIREMSPAFSFGLRNNSPEYNPRSFLKLHSLREVPAISNTSKNQSKDTGNKCNRGRMKPKRSFFSIFGKPLRLA